MGKKYLNTKEGSLEQSVLNVWQEAAEMHAEGMDGRTKEYRSHRGKLESNRVKRENKKNSVKTEQPETLDGSGEHAYEIGTDRYAEYTQKLTPGQIEEEDFIGDDAGKEVNWIKEGVNMENRNLTDTIKNLWIEAAAAAVDPKEREELDKEPDGRGGVESAKKMKRAKEPAPNVSASEEVELDEGTKEEYQKFFNAAMKKFKIDSPADLKSDEEKKKFYDYIDKNYTGEKDEELTKLAKDFKVSSMREVLTKMWTVNEGELPPALKKAIDAKKDKEKKEDNDSDKKKTLTGKKKAEVDVNPGLIAARKY